MADDFEQKLVFGVAPAPQPDGNVTLLLGIPEGAWDYMKDGKTNTLDLNKVLGIPLQIILYGGKDHDECLRYIHKHNSALGITTEDIRNRDSGITPP